MKKNVSLLLALAMMLTLALTACGGNSGNNGGAPQGGGTPAQTSAPSGGGDGNAPATPDKVYELNFSSQAAEGSTNGDWAKLLAGKIAEVTNGGVKINWYFSSTLVGENDIVTAIRTRLCDGGEVPMARQANAFPLFNLLMEPYSNLGKGETMWANVVSPLLSEFPEMAAEFNGLHIGGFYACTNGGTMHTTSEVRVPADLQGKMLSTVTAFQTNITSAAGGSPMTLEASDWYSSFERGLADGMWMTWGAIQGMRLYEVLPYHTIFPSGTDRSMTVIAFNEDVWNSLPTEYQEAIDGIVEWSCEQWPAIEDADYASMVEALTAEGNTFSELTPEEEAQWSDLAAALVQEDVDKVDGQGLPGTAVYQRILELGEIFRFHAIFQVEQCAFLIFHVFQ